MFFRNGQVTLQRCTFIKRADSVRTCRIITSSKTKQNPIKPLSWHVEIRDTWIWCHYRSCHCQDSTRSHLWSKLAAIDGNHFKQVLIFMRWNIISSGCDLPWMLWTTLGNRKTLSCCIQVGFRCAYIVPSIYYLYHLWFFWKFKEKLSFTGALVVFCS